MDAPTGCLLITYSAELDDGEPIFVSSNSLPVKAKFHPAGHAFHLAALKQLGLLDEEDTDTDDQSVQSDDKDSSNSFKANFSSRKGKKKKSTSKQQDHYALLGLEHLRFLATEEQIKKGYRETALKHHPDKQAALILAEKTEEARQKKKEDIESHFKTIQEAYETLIDPVKRRIFDSTDECDDEIPTDCVPQDFFKVFGPAFMRNGRWSVSQPVPSLGEENTPIKEVDRFYDFWYSFKSWREFPQDDDFDLDQAESRDHRRWMDRQNLKLREKSRKEEHARLRALVENAYKRDPRILRRKELEKAEKQRKKESKYLAKKLQEEEAARSAEEEKRRKEEEEKIAVEAALNQKKLREKEKKLLRKEKTRLRTLVAPILSEAALCISEEDVEKACSSLEMEQLRDFCDSMESKDLAAKAQLLKAVLGGGGLRNGSQHSDASPKDVVAAQADKPSLLRNFEKKEKPWGKEEIDMLRKGMQKYPKGTAQRWEVISQYIGTGRSVEEILKATKTVLLQKPDSSKAFDSFLEKRKPVQNIESPLSSRTELGGSPIDGGASVAPAQSSTSGGSNDEVKDEDQKVPGEAVPPTPNGVAAPVAEADLWSAVQEKALIQALKSFPKDASQRWERVAAAVPGKTVNQCKKKFAVMRESFRSKKGGPE